MIVTHFYLNLSFCFAVKKSRSATLIYISVSANEPSQKPQISGVMLKVVPESKIQFISCKLSPKSLLGLSALVDIFSIDAYIFCDSLSSVIFSDVLSILLDLYAQVLGF